MDLGKAIKNFDRAEANLQKLERLSDEIESDRPRTLSFDSDPEEQRRIRAYVRVLRELPRIDGWKPVAVPWEREEVSQARFDANEVGPEAKLAVEREIEAPGRELREYRSRLEYKRRELIREPVRERIDEINSLLSELADEELRDDRERGEEIEGEKWECFKKLIRQIEALLCPP